MAEEKLLLRRIAIHIRIGRCAILVLKTCVLVNCISESIGNIFVDDNDIGVVVYWFCRLESRTYAWMKGEDMVKFVEIERHTVAYRRFELISAPLVHSQCS